MRTLSAGVVKRRAKRQSGFGRTYSATAKQKKRRQITTMQNALVSKFISKNARQTPHPEFRPGDTIRVHVKIKEGDKERLQAF